MRGKMESGVILFTVLIYLCIMHILIFATHDLIRSSAQIKHVMHNAQMLSEDMEKAIMQIEGDLQHSQFPHCTQAWGNANADHYCHLTKDATQLRYLVELMAEDPCEKVAVWQQNTHSIQLEPAQHYRVTLYGKRHISKQVIQTTGVLIIKKPKANCSTMTRLVSVGRHSWRE